MRYIYILIAILLSGTIVTCNEEPVPSNPLFHTWLFYHGIYTNCSSGGSTESVYPCDESSCLQVTFTDSRFYVQDVQFDVFVSVEEGNIIIDESDQTITSVTNLEKFIGVCGTVDNPSSYIFSGDTLRISYYVEESNCTHISTLIKKY